MRLPRARASSGAGSGRPARVSHQEAACLLLVNREAQVFGFPSRVRGLDDGRDALHERTVQLGRLQPAVVEEHLQLA
jgi:hypothetical protein